MLKITHLSKRYGSLQALDSLSFDVGAHELVGFVGANGAGKSTTMRIIMGVLEGDGGTVTWNGAPVDAERNTAMPSAFLVEQMAWREDIDEVRDMGDLEAAHRLQARLEAERNRVIEGIATLIDEQGDYPSAAMQVRQLMFFERLRTNLADVVRQMGKG